MKFLADENMHAHIVRWLRDQGHDVLWATESLCGQPDSVLLETARVQQRLILTADLDFGELVFQQRLNSEGVVLLRIEQLTVLERIARLQTVWSIVESNPNGRFIVITDRKVRVRIMPTPLES